VAYLTEGEKARIRRALGYVGTSESTAYSFGTTHSVEYLFLVNARMAAAFEVEFLELIREDLGRAERTVDQLFEAQERLAARQTGSLTLNPDNEIAALKQSWQFWAGRLADSLGLPRYPNAHATAGGGLNARVAL
jgi:hypothetical protein